ncbi:hypothetical protein SDC9_162058 [bioreactor metagenome]|jgi:hypothetical protein|uniref:Uncharacterized protein n=1 Tax=bioreactor metagenome TaxID=1076179 RepID=A0A645FK29_9ZZZZ
MEFYGKAELGNNAYFTIIIISYNTDVLDKAKC